MRQDEEALSPADRERRSIQASKAISRPLVAEPQAQVDLDDEDSAGHGGPSPLSAADHEKLAESGIEVRAREAHGGEEDDDYHGGRQLTPEEEGALKEIGVEVRRPPQHSAKAPRYKVRKLDHGEEMRLKRAGIEVGPDLVFNGA